MSIKSLTKTSSSQDIAAYYKAAEEVFATTTLTLDDPCTYAEFFNLLRVLYGVKREIEELQKKLEEK